MTHLNLKKISRIILGFAFFFILVSGKADNKELDANNVFDHIRPAFELMEFISNAEFIEDYNLAYSNLIDDLRKQQIHLLPSTASKTKGKSYIGQKDTLHFVSKNGSHRVNIFQHPDGEYLFNCWKNALRETGLKSDIRNDEGGSVFLKVKTKGNSAIGALFYTGRNVFHIELNLSFPVPESYNELDSTSQLIINNKFQELYLILKTIANTYVASSEYVFYPSHGKSLTSAQRLYGFTQFWTEVKYNFAYFDQVPDLNWDHVLAEYLPIIQRDQSNEEYYNNMKKLCALLKDGHTNIYPPHSVEVTFDTPALQLINIQNKAIVENVTRSLESEIPIGSEITKVDGTPTEMYLKDNVFPFISSSTEHILYDWGIRDLLKGKSGISVKIEFKTPDGKETQLVLERNRKTNKVEWLKPGVPWKLFEFKRLPGNIAYVSLNSFGSNKIVQEFRNHIDTINSCKGLIIDLRANGGGNSTNGYEIIEHLTDKPFLTSKWRTREHRASYKAWGRFHTYGYRDNFKLEHDTSEWAGTVRDYYKGERWYTEVADTIVPNQKGKIFLPLVVLTGHNTASAAEDFLIALDNLKIATVIGDRTFGSTGQPLMLDLPGGGSARICTKRDEYPDGRQFVGYGIEPDIYVENTIDDFLKKNDATLKKGLDLITKPKN